MKISNAEYTITVSDDELSKLLDALTYAKHDIKQNMIAALDDFNKAELDSKEEHEAQVVYLQWKKEFEEFNNMSLTLASIKLHGKNSTVDMKEECNIK